MRLYLKERVTIFLFCVETGYALILPISQYK